MTEEVGIIQLQDTVKFLQLKIREKDGLIERLNKDLRRTMDVSSYTIYANFYNVL